MKGWLGISVAAAFLLGCSTIQKETVKTGLFNDDLAQLSRAYEKASKLELGKASQKEVESLGFNFSAPNVERLLGPAAFRRIFGETVFQNALSDPAKAEALLVQLNQYQAFFIPFRNITTKTDRIYFSRKNVSNAGDNLLVLFVFKNGQLFYRDYQYVKVDSQTSETAFAEGFVQAIRLVGDFSNLLNYLNLLNTKSK